MNKVLVHIHVDPEIDTFVKQHQSRMTEQGIVLSKAAVFRQILIAGMDALKQPRRKK